MITEPTKDKRAAWLTRAINLRKKLKEKGKQRLEEKVRLLILKFIQNVR